jgi:hypothetical protein
MSAPLCDASWVSCRGRGSILLVAMVINKSPFLYLLVIYRLINNRWAD